MKRTDPCLVVNGGLLGGGDRQGGISSLSLSLSPSSLLRPASLLLLLDYLHLFFSSSYLSSPLCRIYYHGTPGLLCEAVRSLSLYLLSYRAVVPFSIPPSFRLPPQSNTKQTHQRRRILCLYSSILVDAVSPFLKSHAYPGFDELIVFTEYTEQYSHPLCAWLFL